MPVLGILEIGIQVFFAVHAIKTGRERWLFLIVFFPVVGCLIYFFSEFLPSFRIDAGVEKAGAGLWRWLNPEGEIKKWRHQVEIAATVENRRSLADALARAGRYDEAIALYQGCLDGLHKEDLHVWEGLSRALFKKGDFQGAEEALLRTKAILKKPSPETDLWYARTLAEQGKTEEALRVYASLIPLASGEEARARYALLLKKTGQVEKAKEVFQEILKNIQLSTRFYKRSQREWKTLAQREIGTA